MTGVQTCALPISGELHVSASGAVGMGDIGTLKLIDDSGATANASVNQGGRVFNIVSGSIASGTFFLHASLK